MITLGIDGSSAAKLADSCFDTTVLKPRQDAQWI
jgi:hypothetical protein